MAQWVVGNTLKQLGAWGSILGRDKNLYPRFSVEKFSVSSNSSDVLISMLKT